MALTGAAACASGGHASDGANALPFDEALVTAGSVYEPTAGFRAVADGGWWRGMPSPTQRGMAGTAWMISTDCTVRFANDPEALAASEGVLLPTHRLVTDACHDHGGFWQEGGGRVFWWMELAGGWSAEYYAEPTGDSAMAVRRFALRRRGARNWRVEPGSLTTLRVSRAPAVSAAAAPGRLSWDVTRALRAIGESDWATKPGAGRVRTIAGTRWRDAGGCTLLFGSETLARASGGQRLTRPLQSATCGGLRGSWQQAGSRLVWRVNYDSTRAGETYADVVSDSLMRTRYYELRRPSPRAEWQATWLPGEARTLRKVRR